jgi:hypothetical protein
MQLTGILFDGEACCDAVCPWNTPRCGWISSAQPFDLSQTGGDAAHQFADTTESRRDRFPCDKRSAGALFHDLNDGLLAVNSEVERAFDLVHVIRW